MLNWEAAKFVPAVGYECYRDGARRRHIDEFRARHQEVVSAAKFIVDGLDQLTRSGRLSRPVDFAVGTIRLIEAMDRYLHWQDDVLLPLARDVLDDDRLNGMVEALFEQPVLTAPGPGILLS